MNHSEATKQKVSVFRRVMLPFVLTAVLDCALLLLLLWAGGIFTSMYESGLNILGETTQNQYRQLEQSMLSWGNLDRLGEQVVQRMEQTLAERNKTPEDMRDDPELSNALMDDCKELLVEELRLNTPNGVFIVLDAIGVKDKPDSHAGIFLYDASPYSVQAGNSDLSLMRGLPPLSRKLGITLDSFWEPTFTIAGGAENRANDYYYKPLNAYAQRKNLKTPAKYYDYWCMDFVPNPANGKKTVSCTRPLTGTDGTVYGVYGVMIETGNIQSVFTSAIAERGNDSACFYVGVSVDGGSSYQCVTTEGKGFVKNFTSGEKLEALRTVSHNNTEYIVVDGGRTGKEFYGAVFPLRLYGSNTPFEDMRWALVGLRASEDVFVLENRFRNSVSLVTVLGLTLGLLIALWAANGISRPITRLVRELRNPKRMPFDPLNDTGIREVDELADTITKLNQDAMEEAARFSKIIALSGLPVGTFEMRRDIHAVYCSDSFFGILDCPELHNEQNRVTEEAFERLLKDKLKETPAFGAGTYLVRDADPEQYVRLRILEKKDGAVGTLMDVTAEVQKQKQIEHERDHDVLTSLLDRRAFEARANELFTGAGTKLDKVSAMMMMDLDNLKAVNDTYGHDRGDQYIHDFAMALDCLKDERCLVGRRSGDEFFIFYYGYPSKDAIRKIIRQGWRAIQHRCSAFPDGTKLKLRASGGVAWYPDNAENFTQLLHYADFAMYRVKNSLKGSVREFSQKEYDQEGYRIDGIQALSRMLEQDLVRYAYQPIVSAVNGALLGYELLMRPQVKELPTPLLVLNLAEEQGMLKQLEGMTWRVALASARQLRERGGLESGARLFINSIPNQILSPEDEELVMHDDIGLFPSVVMEITEEENPDDDMAMKKFEIFQGMGVEIALEVAGTSQGANTRRIEDRLTYIKLDKILIRSIDREPERRALIENAIQRAHRRNVRVIAVGVETREELYTLSAMGVDYFQGYYIARPEWDPPTVRREAIEEIRAARAARE